MSVKIVELPGLAEHGDVTDWLEAGHTVEDLLKVVEAVDAAIPPAWATQSLDQIEFDRLAALPRVEYDRARKDAAQRLGIGLRTLDEEVEARRATNDPRQASGTALAFDEIGLWGETVDGGALLDDIVAALKKHVVFPTDHHALAVALWTVHGHLLSEAEHSPRLHITAPTKGCGKTVLLNTVASLVPRPLRVEHVTPAALFRVIEEHHPTLLIDEVDTFLKDNEDMRGLLNAGHQPDARVVRCVGDRQEVRTFSVFAATALAGIGEIPATIEDRSITIPLRRRAPSDEQVERLRRSRGHLSVTARRIARWAEDNRSRLVEDPQLPEDLGDRAQDNWRLMIAIADAMGEATGTAARNAARVLELERDQDDNDAGLMALADVHAVFERRGSERLSSQHVVDALVAMEDRPWAHWRRGNPVTQNSLARLLKPFGIKTKQVKAFNGKGYERSPVTDAFNRYCAPKPDEEMPDVDDPI